MKQLKTKTLCRALELAMAVAILSSCSDDDKAPNMVQGIVTVKKTADNRTFLQLDEQTTLFPSNITQQIFDGKEVRAQVLFTVLDEATQGFTHTVKVNAIDSIRTKGMVELQAGESASRYGSDPVEVMNNWMTVAEDGYLTLRLRTRWGMNGTRHEVNLVTGTNPEDPFEVVLCHDAKGDVAGPMADALIAFRLDKLPAGTGKRAITMKWNSLEQGTKSHTFELAN